MEGNRTKHPESPDSQKLEQEPRGGYPDESPARGGDPPRELPLCRDKDYHPAEYSASSRTVKYKSRALPAIQKYLIRQEICLPARVGGR